MSGQKLITCIVPEGMGLSTLEALYRSHDICTADFHVASGIGKSTQYGQGSLGQQTEKDMLTVVVSADKADELFAFIYDQAKINRPHGGIIYMNDLGRSSEYCLPAEATPLSR